MLTGKIKQTDTPDGNINNKIKIFFFNVSVMININYQGDLAARKLDSLRDFVMINTSSIAKHFLLHPYALSERRKKRARLVLRRIHIGLSSYKSIQG